MARKILVVDDERHIVQQERVALEGADYEVVIAYDGVEALEQVKSEMPDMIILDIMMPRKDGFEVMRDLRADPATANIPVIILTAKAQDADIYRGWQSGISSYLTKPFNSRELLTSVERIFRSLDEDPAGVGSEAWEV